MYKLSLYCNCFDINLNRHTQVNQTNLMCGASALTPEYKQELAEKNFVFDDTGDNISHLNKWLGDLTGLYWVWKNTNNEYVGTNQYRRFYEDSDLLLLDLKPNTIYITAPLVFDTNNYSSTYDQFVRHHTDLAFKILYGAIAENKVNFPPHLIEGLRGINHLSPCNMFFAQRDTFNKLCDILFSIIMELYEGSKYAMPWIQPAGQSRMLAFLAERILHMVYLNKNYYFGPETNVHPINWNMR